MAGNNARIMIADDDSVSRYLLANLFNDKYAVTCVKSGEEALAAVMGLRPDLIILDVVMKGINGFETCMRLKANKDTVDIPVVFISSREDTDTELTGLKAGGLDFITKPFHPSIVRMRISNYIEMKKNRDDLERMSITDPLTGLYNRGYFDRMLQSEVRRCARSGLALSLLMIDIDGFKQYNDHNGHPAGDECLRMVCQSVKSLFRRVGDVVARYGGEEVAVLLPATDRNAARGLAEQARAGVEALGIARGGQDGGVLTVSVGAASTIPVPNEEHVLLLNAADKALYQAKLGGRNRVSVAAN